MIQTRQHTNISAPPGFEELSKSEQVEYLRALWDRIAEQPEEIPVPESHLALAEERPVDYRRDPKSTRSAYEVLVRLVKKRQ